MIKIKRKSDGYAFILVIFAIVLIAIVTTAVLTIIDIFLDRKRFDATILEMTNIKAAMVGKPLLVSNDTRTDFGYVGDMGNLPSVLDKLVEKGSQPDFNIDPVTGIGMGWNGPYLSWEFSEETDGYKRDAWGTEYNYNQANGTITSAGSDRTFGSGSGYAQDITKTINQSEYLTDISGSIRDSSGNPVTEPSWVNITLYYPNQGTEISLTTTVASDGTFSFNNIPVGIRRMVITPLVGNLGKETSHLVVSQPPLTNIAMSLHANEGGTLYYVQGSGMTLGSEHDVVEIDVGNSDEVNNLVITGVLISWEGGPNWGGEEAYLERIYTDSITYWRARRRDGESGEFIDLSNDILILNDSILDNLRFEFGEGRSPRRRPPINMERTGFEIQAYFETGQTRTISFATP